MSKDSFQRMLEKEFPQGTLTYLEEYRFMRDNYINKVGFMDQETWDQFCLKCLQQLALDNEKVANYITDLEILIKDNSLIVPNTN